MSASLEAYLARLYLDAAPRQVFIPDARTGAMDARPPESHAARASWLRRILDRLATARS